MAFIGRSEELDSLKNEFSKINSRILLYGRRRVGKTTLIIEASKAFDGNVLYYECVQSSVKDNLLRITEQVKALFGNAYLAFSDFTELFTYLDSAGKKVLIIIDEYQYLKNLASAGEMDSHFQKICDAMQGPVHLVLSGSYVSVMKELLAEGNPLFGRFSLILNLKPLDYYDSSLFFPKAGTEYKISAYAIFGGLPFACSLIDPSLSIAANIKNLLLKKSGVLRSYMEFVLLSELGRAGNANKILSALGNGKQKYKELESKALFPANGLLDKSLKILTEMQLIAKTYPVNKPNDSKKGFYEACDNLIRFYYTFIFGNEHYIEIQGENTFYKNFIAKRLEQFIARRFEDIVREYFIRQLKLGKLEGVMDIGRLWYDDAAAKTNGEFDLVLKHTDDAYSFYEVKFTKKPLTLALCRHEEEQVQHIAGLLKVSVKKTGFVSLSGFNFKSAKPELITADALYKKNP